MLVNADENVHASNPKQEEEEDAFFDKDPLRNTWDYEEHDSKEFSKV